MAKILRIPDAMENALCDHLVDALDTGGAGSIQLRTGVQNADPDSAASGTLLASCLLASPAFGNAVAGIATANAIGIATAVAGGTIGHARVVNGSGICIFECNVGLAAATPTIVLDTLTVSINDEITISSFTMEMPLG